MFNFTLQTSRGEQLNEQADETVAYLHGYGNILPGMEQASLEKAGNSSQTLSPKDAYGEYIDESPRYHRNSFGEYFDSIYKGMALPMQNDMGAPITFYVTDKDNDPVTITRNSTCREELLFTANILQVRDASLNELNARRALGTDGKDKPIVLLLKSKSKVADTKHFSMLSEINLETDLALTLYGSVSLGISWRLKDNVVYFI